MTRIICATALALACAGLTLARLDAADDKAGGDADFVKKASAAGLGEVNLGILAAKYGGAEVKKFANHMVKDHTKANQELLKLADARRLTVARTMDADHSKTMDKLATMSGADFDRMYMDGQVKDHKEAVALFEKQAKEGKDADLRGWAEKTLPTIREHLKMAQKVQERLKGGAKTTAR
jgi:putative membrane protein